MGQVSIACNVRVQGRYKLKVYYPNGECRLETPWFDNLITDNGMEQIAVLAGAPAIAELCTQCYIGSGAIAPAIGNIQLSNLLYTANSVGVSSYAFFDGVEAYWRAYKIFTFNAGNATGDIREVGVGYASNNLFSRSLIQGVMEVPITITVLSDEKLEVYYERRNYIDKTDKFATFVMLDGSSSSVYSVQVRPTDINVVPDLFRGYRQSGINLGVNFTVYEQKTLAVVYSPLSNTSAAYSGVSCPAYIPNSHYLDYTFTFDATVGNFTGGIGTAAFIANQCKFQMRFTPYIPKTVQYRLRFKIRTLWSRYVPAL